MEQDQLLRLIKLTKTDPTPPERVDIIISLTTETVSKFLLSGGLISSFFIIFLDFS